jgi:hypothetical protein
MTIAIQRQPRLQKVLWFVGMVGLVAALAIGIAFVEREDVAGPAATSTARHAGMGERFMAIQDGYLTPQAVLDREAALEAEIRLQDGYLPPAKPVDALLFIQDGYLPPSGWLPAEPSDGGTTSPRFGPQ